MEKVKHIGGTFAIIAFIGIIFFRSCLTVSDKTGFYIGTDKNGRQIFIQTLSHYLEPDVTATSDFFDYNFLQRIWIEPMRTTLKLQSHISIITWNDNSINKFLSMSTDSLLTNDNAEFAITEKYSIPITDLKLKLQKDSIYNTQQFLEGMGFERIIFINQNGDQVSKKLNGHYFKNIGF